ncbi:MAG: alkaline phosphatase family protein [Anaerolineae bacterium]
MIVISVDGLRPDALLQAQTPQMDQLWQNGAYSWTAQTVLPSVTLVSHASMLSGVPPEVHGMVWNNWEPSRGYIGVPTVFSLARQNGFATAMVVGKRKLEHLAAPGTVDRFEFPGNNAEIVGEASVRAIRELRPGVLFVHFPDPDTTGHALGWMSAAQLDAVARVDAAIGQILRALDETGQRPSSLVILSADHGGHLFSHGSDDPQDMTIPWIAQGPGVPVGFPISAAVRTFDTAATVLHALGIPVPAGWAGTPVLEALPALAAAGSG